MIKTLLVIAGSIALASCKKEFSVEKQCGIVLDKRVLFRHEFELTVSYEGKLQAIEVGLLQYNQYEIGDPYCE